MLGRQPLWLWLQQSHAEVSCTWIEGLLLMTCTGDQPQHALTICRCGGGCQCCHPLASLPWAAPGRQQNRLSVFTHPDSLVHRQLCYWRVQHCQVYARRVQGEQQRRLSTKALHCMACPVSLILVLGMSYQPGPGAWQVLSAWLWTTPAVFPDLPALCCLFLADLWAIGPGERSSLKP